MGSHEIQISGMRFARGRAGCWLRSSLSHPPHSVLPEVPKGASAWPLQRRQPLTVSDGLDSFVYYCHDINRRFFHYTRGKGHSPKRINHRGTTQHPREPSPPRHPDQHLLRVIGFIRLPLSLEQSEASHAMSCNVGEDQKPPHSPRKKHPKRSRDQKNHIELISKEIKKV